MYEPPAENRLSTGRALLALAGAAVLFHALGHDPVHSLFGAGDGFTAGLPGKIFATSLSSWNPWVQLGQYTYPNTQYQPFYLPGLLLLSIAPNTLGYNLFILLHYVLAGWFAWLFLRTTGLTRFACLVGALLFELSGFLSAHKGHVAMISAAVWLPLILWAIDAVMRGAGRRAVAAGATGVAMSVLGGFPQISTYTLMLAAAYAAYRAVTLDGVDVKHRWLRLTAVTAGILGLGVLASAIQLAPVAASLSQMTRERLDFATFTQDSFPVTSLAGFVMPNIFGGLYGIPPYGSTINFVEMYAYMGLIPLALAIGAAVTARLGFRDTRFWALVVLAACLLALGSATPLARAMFVVPVYNLFRAPARHLFEMQFGIAVLAAAGVDVLLGLDDARRRRMGRVAMSALVVMFAATMVYAQTQAAAFRAVLEPGHAADAAKSINPLHTVGEVAPYVIRNLAGPTAGLLIPISFFALSLLALEWSRRRGAGAPILLLSVLLADLYAANGFIYRYTGTRPVFRHREEIQALTAAGYDPARDRIFPLDPDLRYTYPLLNIVAGVSVINDYSPMWLSRYRTFAPFYPNGVMWPNFTTNDRLLAVTSARYLIMKSDDIRARLKAAHATAKGISVTSDGLPADGAWTLDHARMDAGMVTLESPGQSHVGLAQRRVTLAANTTYMVSFDARADRPLDVPLIVDLYAGAGYDRAEQDRTIPVLFETFSRQTLFIDSGAYIPAGARLRLFTNATVPVQIKNVRLEIVSNPAPSPFKELATTSDGVSIFENTLALPRFRFAQMVVPARDVLDAREIFEAPEFDATTAATVEGIDTREMLDAGEIVRQTIGNARMHWTVRTGARSFFVVGDSWFPGWRATVDGRDARIYPADGFLRGVFIDGAGQHDVEMTFHPPGFVAGLTTTAAATIAIAVLLWRRRPLGARIDRPHHR